MAQAAAPAAIVAGIHATVNTLRSLAIVVYPDIMRSRFLFIRLELSGASGNLSYNDGHTDLEAHHGRSEAKAARHECRGKKIEWRENARSLPARTVERTRIILDASPGLSVSEIAQRRQCSRPMVMKWLTRFNVQGLAGLNDEPRSGRPTTYTPEEVATVISAALSDPQKLKLPLAAWTLDHLEQYLNERRGITIKRSGIGDLLLAEGLRWRKQEHWFGERVDPDFAEKRGDRIALYCAARRQRRRMHGSNGA